MGTDGMDIHTIKDILHITYGLEQISYNCNKYTRTRFNLRVDPFMPQEVIPNITITGVTFNMPATLSIPISI